MKKIIAIIVLVLCTACSFNNKLEDHKEIKYDDSYIEVIPENAKKFIKDDDQIILTLDEIFKYNEEIKSKTDSIFDLKELKKLTSNEIRSLITKYKVPSLPKYTGKGEVTSEDVNIMVDNRNIDNITDKDTLTKGIIVNRANLKGFPTDVHFYDSNGVYNFDRIQETELHVNTPVLIIHESKDTKYSFVIAYNYSGWVKNEDIAIANDDDWNFFIDTDSFGIITEPLLEIDNVLLDMSTKLPYKGVTEDGYKFTLPTKDSTGYVSKKEVIIARDKAHIGYLPYTKNNVYIQAFKYEGIPYKWSGMDNGVDCSSYVSNVFRTFGFMFPRNTADQNGSVGKITYLNNKSNDEKLSIITGNETSLLYQPGHVMIYLGIVEDKHFVIHASGNTLEVSVMELNNSNNLKNIDKLVVIK